MGGKHYVTLYNGERIPRIGLGTWRIGGEASPDHTRDAEMINLIRAAIDMGYSLIDTAEMYASGHTETLIGQAMRGYNRSELFIITKVWHTQLRYRDVIQSLNQSLHRLDTDYVDLFLIHWPNPSIHLEETFEAMNELASQGKARHLGVSNFDLSALKRARTLAKPTLANVQVRYSLTQRMPAQNGMLAYCQENDIVLTAYSPIKGGLLSRPSLQEIAHKYGVRPAQVALNWLIRQPKVNTIPMSTNPAHLKDNLGAIDLTLENEDIRMLDEMT
jgi:diketogulonate reductase-like aldo/keto reductase